MVTTENEAAHIWCPMMRLPQLVTNGPGGQIMGVAATNVDQNGQDRLFKCVGSNCMMWRWQDTQASTAKGPAERRGYCGIAGAPRVWP
jgi:hypothetical protein